MTARRIALLSGWYYPDSVGGTEAYVAGLAAELAALGNEVCVVVPSDSATARHEGHEGIPVFRYPADTAPSREAIRRDSPPLYHGAFEAWLDDWKPDLVHIHSLTGTMGLAHAQSAKERGLPLVLTVHVPGLTCPRGTMMRWGTVPCDGEFRTYRCAACCLQANGLPRALAWPTAVVSGSGVFSGWMTRAGTALQYADGLRRRDESVHELFALADHVVVVCDWLRRVLVLNGVDAGTISLSRHGLPAAVQTGYPENRRSAETLRIGFLGRFDPVKGVHVLVDAFRQLPEDLPIELHLRGTAIDDNLGYLRELKDAAAGDARIVFGGPLTSGERHDVLSTWHVMAVPSVWFETGPLVVLEAFAAGMPVLGSHLGGIAELVEDGQSGVLAQANDVGDWSRALMDLVSRFQRGDWSWTLPDLRTTSDVSEDMASLYRAILSERLS